MKYSPRQYASALHSMVSGKTEEAAAIEVKKFAAFLKKNNALHFHREIAEKFADICRESDGKKKITIKAANHEIAQKIKARFGESADTKIVVDKELIAGASITIDNLRIDNSVKSRLSQMKKALAH